MRETENSLYQRIVIIGMGVFPIAVYRVCIEYHSHIDLIEYGEASDYFRKICAQEHITYRNLSRDELTVFLDSITETSLIISAVNKYIFPGSILAKPNIIAINYHNSMLPHHKGSHAEAFSIFNGDQYAGVTWHYIIEKIDEGGIISAHTLKIGHDETSLSLLTKQNAQALKAFKEFLPDLLVNNIAPVQQKTSTGEFHLSKDLPADGVLNLTWPLEKMYAFLRSFDYGGYKMFEQPRVVFQNGTYVWGNYKLVEGTSKRNETILNERERILEIHRDGSKYHILLQNIEKHSDGTY